MVIELEDPALSYNGNISNLTLGNHILVGRFHNNEHWAIIEPKEVWPESTRETKRP